ncbi:MAG TPA: alpha/beta fold hydrolase [Candidatus Limnocylindria bacterium]
MSSLPINDVALAYDEAGSGHPLALVHAGIVDRRMWDPVWDAFAARYRTIRHDMRGYGETPLPNGPHAAWRDLAVLLRELDAAPAHVVGVSEGGSTSIALAIAEPKLVDRLVLVGPGMAGWEWSDGLRATWAEEEAAYERGDLEEVAWINVRTWLDGRRPAEAVHPDLRQAVWEMQRHALDQENDSAPAEPLEPPIRERLAEVQAPTLIIVGALDQPDMLGIGQHLAGAIPNARLEVMSGVAHLPPMEAPEAFVALVTAFLEAT